MFVIIVGGGKTGSQLAQRLHAEGHQIKLIEDRQMVLDRLKHELPEEFVLMGDGSAPEILEKAGVREAQVVAAVTGEDETNLVITTLAKFEYQVPRVIGRINNPKNAWLFSPEMGVDVGLNQSEILAQLIMEEMSMGDMMTLMKLRRGEYSLVEEKVHPEAMVVGKTIRDLDLPPKCVFVAILRHGELILPKGETRLQAVDEVIALVHASQVECLAHFLGKSS